jgi:hypothetical protein
MSALEFTSRCAGCSLPEHLPHVGPFVERNEEQVCKSCAFFVDEKAEEDKK